MHATFLLSSIPTNSALQKTSCSRGTQGSFPELRKTCTSHWPLPRPKLDVTNFGSYTSYTLVTSWRAKRQL